MKLFKTNNIEIVELCQYQSGSDKSSVAYYKKHVPINLI